MEEQGRHHEITPALNSELLIFGVPKVLFLVSAGIGLVVFIVFWSGDSVWSFLGPVLIFLFLCVISYWLTADDPAFPAILASALKHKPVYDPFLYEEYDVRWK